MGNWLISEQNKDGSFPSNISHYKITKVPKVFDTGQIIFGLISLYKITKDEKFLDASIKAAEWILAMQEDDGSWIKFTFKASPRVYCSRIAYALLLLWEITRENKIIDSANKNYDWALKNQDDDG